MVCGKLPRLPESSSHITGEESWAPEFSKEMQQAEG